MKKAKPTAVSLCISDRILCFCENLTLIFIALRIAGVIDWSIWQVLMPMFLAIIVPIVIGVLLGIGRWMHMKEEEEGNSDD